MRILLDTHILLWVLMKTREIPEKWRNELASLDNEILYSAASIWEIAIKATLRRSDFEFEPDEIIENANRSGFVALPVDPSSAAAVKAVPNHHGDPFDRLLIAQARRENAILLTADKPLLAYGEPVQLVR